MRQLLPFPCDPVDPAVPYDDLPSARTRPVVRLNMIASMDGAAAVGGVSGGLGGPADQALFAVLRSQADVVLVAAGTVRAERYGPLDVPVAVLSRSCRLDWDSALFTAAVTPPIVVTVAEAPALERKRAAALGGAGRTRIRPRARRGRPHLERAARSGRPAG
jgi:5-amino-6-(5-phosphoribosylamino)uracil reductase